MERDRHRRVNCGTGSWRARRRWKPHVRFGTGGTNPPAETRTGRSVRSHLANIAVDETRRAEWNTARRAGGVGHPVWGRTRTVSADQLLKHTRWALLKDPPPSPITNVASSMSCAAPATTCSAAWALKEERRDLYRLPAGVRPDAHLDAWLARACRCRIFALVALTKTIRAHRDDILAAVDLGLSNPNSKDLNSKIRLINHRGYGHHSAAAITAMLYLCCSGLITLPTQR